MTTKYPVYLNEAERQYLKQLVSSGKEHARKIRRANILLKTDQSEEGAQWSHAQIAAAFLVSEVTICEVRRCYAAGGLEAALQRKLPDRVYEHRLDGEQEAHLIALACGTPPDGYAVWSLRLLARQLVQLGHVDGISHETIRQVLKKRTQTVAQRNVVHCPQSQC